MKSIKFENPDSTIVLTLEQAKILGINPTENNEGIMETVGMWHIIKSYKALCGSAIYTKEGFKPCTEQTFYGIRTMYNIRQSGHVIEGYVSVNGKKYTCFSSSQLFEIDGKLIDVAIVRARIG